MSLRNPATAILLAVLSAGILAGRAVAASGQPAARSVILLIGDGLGLGHVKAASVALHGVDGRLAMQGCPASGRAYTNSSDSAEPDAAAAATALATGRKTDNGALSISASGTVLKTILEACRESGRATGLVTDGSVANPAVAGFVVHTDEAGQAYDVAGALVDKGPDIVLGGGRGSFAAPRGEAWMGVNVTDAKGRKILTVTDTVNWFEYRVLQHGFLAPPGSVRASVWMWRGPGRLGLFVDDVTVVPQDDKGNPTGANLVGDPGFDGGGPGAWENWGHMGVAADGGSNALKVAGQGGGQLSVPVVPGRSYGVGYRARMEDPRTAGTDAPLDRAAKAGWRVVGRKADLAGARGARVLGLFSEGALGKGVDEPSLSDMVEGGVAAIGGRREGFLLVVAGSRIDSASRARNEADMVGGVKAFDAAVASAVALAKSRGDVLVVVASGRETGGLKESGGKAAFTSAETTNLPVPVFAFGPGSERFTGEMDTTDIPKRIAEVLGLSL